jgi:GR25 family glycosyltransferase involved in LPS biosynthesis
MELSTNTISITLIILIILLIASLIVLEMCYPKSDYYQQQYNRLVQLTEKGPFIDKFGVPVLYINLEHSVERRDYMESQLSRINADYRRVDAVDARRHLAKDVHEFQINGEDYTLEYDMPEYDKPGERGVIISHTLCFITALELGYDAVVVLEDDCCLLPMVLWEYDLATVLEYYPDDLDIYQMFALFHHRGGRVKRTAWAAAAYYITRRGMKKWLKYMQFEKDGNTFKIKSKDGSMLIDRELFEHCNTYLSEVPLLFPNSFAFPSTIRNEKVVDNLFCEPISYWVTRRKNYPLITRLVSMWMVEPL